MQKCFFIKYLPENVTYILMVEPENLFFHLIKFLSSILTCLHRLSKEEKYIFFASDNTFGYMDDMYGCVLHIYIYLYQVVDRKCYNI